MTALEIPYCFRYGEDELIGVLHRSIRPSPRGVLIVVGGPQYRVGSHRQFLLLARYLAREGIATFRFDYRGMGDSGGDPHTFETIDEDIRAAIDVFCMQVPELEEVVIWGLCDAATAASFYASRDARVTGLVLLNPWVRTESGIAKAYLQHYYVGRIFQREFWNKVVHGKFDLRKSAESLFGMLRSVIDSEKPNGKVHQAQMPKSCGVDGVNMDEPLPLRMYQGLKHFRGKLLFVLSGDDLTADEFRSVAKNTKQWRKLMRASRVTIRELNEANHTFSQRGWRDQVAEWTLQWLRSW